MPTPAETDRAVVQRAQEQLQRVHVRDWLISRLEDVGKFVIEFPPQGAEHGFCRSEEHNGDIIKFVKFDSEITPREMESSPEILANAFQRNGFDLEYSVSTSVSVVHLSESGTSRFNIGFTQKDLKLDISDYDVKEQLKNSRLHSITDGELAQAIASLELLEGCHAFLQRLVRSRDTSHGPAY